MTLLKAAAFYFAIVFGVGFVLGPLRQLWLAPRVGVRAAELLELPLMLVAIYFAARAIVRRYPQAPRLWFGWLALGFMLVAEITLGVALTGKSVPQVLLDRDPVSGTAYYVALLIFAVMPCYSRP
jgi:hypothetical protein